MAEFEKIVIGGQEVLPVAEKAKTLVSDEGSTVVYFYDDYFHVNANFDLGSSIMYKYNTNTLNIGNMYTSVLIKDKTIEEWCQGGGSGIEVGTAVTTAYIKNEMGTVIRIGTDSDSPEGFVEVGEGRRIEFGGGQEVLPVAEKAKTLVSDEGSTVVYFHDDYFHVNANFDLGSSIMYKYNTNTLNIGNMYTSVLIKDKTIEEWCQGGGSGIEVGTAVTTAYIKNEMGTVIRIGTDSDSPEGFIEVGNGRILLGGIGSAIQMSPNLNGVSIQFEAFGGPQELRIEGNHKHLEDGAYIVFHIPNIGKFRVEATEISQ